MNIEWAGLSRQDPDPLSIILSAKADGRNFAVFVSMEAVEDHGIGACQDIAEQKIIATLQLGSSQRRVEVRNSDFA